MKKINVITIDGPSASGKGALARGISNSFGFKILDSGVLYRLFAYLTNINFSEDEIANQIERNVDFVNNGFKHRNSNGNTNESGQKYVFMAFAERPSATAFNSFPNAR